MQIDARRINAIQLALDALELEARSLDHPDLTAALQTARGALQQASLLLEAGNHFLDVAVEREVVVHIDRIEDVEVDEDIGWLAPARDAYSLELQVPVDYKPPSGTKGDREEKA